MPRTGPKGPPLFDVLASKRRQPTALELALQAALDQRLVDASPTPAGPNSPDEEAVPSDAEASHAPTARCRSSARSLWAVALDDEPPLTSGPVGAAGSAGPRIAAFAAATGAAVRRSAPPSEASTPTPVDAVADEVAGTTAVAPGLAALEPVTVRDASPTEELLCDAALDLGAVAQTEAELGARAPDPRKADVATPAAAVEQPGRFDAWDSVNAQTTGDALSEVVGDSLPELEEDDDFGPLLIPDEPRRRRRSRSRSKASGEAGTALAAEGPGGDGEGGSTPPRRMGRRAGIALGACALALLSLAVWQLLPSDTPVAATGAAAAAPVGNDTDAVDGIQPDDVAMVPWHGIALPASESAGPRLQGATASGFERSALGAAIAAANLVVRVDPQAGAGVYEPTLATQVVGDAERLSQAVRDQAGAAVTDSGSPGKLTGWRLEGDPAGSRVVAHLAVDADVTAGVDFAVPLAWVDGDWRIDAPSSGPFFPTEDLSGDYIPFVQEGSAS